MFPYLSAVMPQIAYAHSVREFIRELLKRFMPGKWIDRVISGSDETFDAKLEEVDRKVSTLRRGGKQRGRYTQKAKAICWSCWTAAANHEEVWRSVNTRITYKAVFAYYHARQSNNQTTKQSNNQKYGIIRDVKKNAKSAVLAALAIAGGNGEA